MLMYTQVSMDMLITRCESLEKGLAQMKGELPSKLAVRWQVTEYHATILSKMLLFLAPKHLDSIYICVSLRVCRAIS